MKTIKNNLMLSLFDYMLKVSACYMAAYLFYYLVLSRLTSYKSNRFYLLFTALLAFVIPLLNPDAFIQPQTISGSSFINRIPAFNLATAQEYIPAENAVNIFFITGAIFIAGVAVCLARFIIQFYSFKKITSKASFINAFFGVKLYQLDMDIMPFSFGNAIYVNRQRHSPEELTDIIKHESVHVHQQHTIDVLIAEVVCILNWYNPFAWLMKKAIKQNLEFLADDTVLQEGADKKSYQYLLLKVTGYSPLRIVSSFKLSSLKQRIYMMNKTRTSKKHLLKLLLMMPLITFMMFAFRSPDTAAFNIITDTQQETFMLSELSYNIADANIDKLVKNAQDKSLLQPGKGFSITIIKNERDRLRLLLEQNGYSNIGSNAISFLIDSTLTNNRFAIQVNIDLKRKESSYNNSKKQLNNIISGKRTLHPGQYSDRIPANNRQHDNNI